MVFFGLKSIGLFDRLYEKTFSLDVNDQQKIEKWQCRLTEQIHFFAMDGIFNGNEISMKSAMELRYALYDEDAENDPWPLCKKITRDYDCHWTLAGKYYDDLLTKEEEFRLAAKTFLEEHRLYSVQRLVKRIKSVASLFESGETIGSPTFKMYHAVQLCHCIYQKVLDDPKIPSLQKTRKFCYVDYSEEVKLKKELINLPKWNTNFLYVFPYYASKNNALYKFNASVKVDADLLHSAFTYFFKLQNKKYQKIKDKIEKELSNKSVKIFLEVLKTIGKDFLFAKQNQNSNLSFFAQSVCYLDPYFLDHLREKQPEAALADLRAHNKNFLSSQGRETYLTIEHLFQRRKIRGKNSWENIMSVLPSFEENVDRWIMSVSEKSSSGLAKKLFSKEALDHAEKHAEVTDVKENRYRGSLSLKGTLRLMQENSVTSQMQRGMLSKQDRKKLIDDLRKYTETIYGAVCKKRKAGELYTLQVRVKLSKPIEIDKNVFLKFSEGKASFKLAVVDEVFNQSGRYYSVSDNFPGLLVSSHFKSSEEEPSKSISGEKLKSADGNLLAEAPDYLFILKSASENPSVMIKIPKWKVPEGETGLENPIVCFREGGEPEQIVNELVETLEAFFKVDVDNPELFKWEMDKTVFSELVRLHNKFAHYLSKGIVLGRNSEMRENFGKNSLRLVHSLYRDENFFLLTSAVGAVESSPVSRLDFMKDLTEGDQVGRGKSERPFIVSEGARNFEAYRSAFKKSSSKALPHLAPLKRDWESVLNVSKDGFQHLLRGITFDWNFFSKFPSDDMQEAFGEANTSIIRDVLNTTKSDEDLCGVLHEISQKIQPPPNLKRYSCIAMLPDEMRPSESSERSDSLSSAEVDEARENRQPYFDQFIDLHFNEELLEEALPELDRKTLEYYQALIHNTTGTPLDKFDFLEKMKEAAPHLDEDALEGILMEIKDAEGFDPNLNRLKKTAPNLDAKTLQLLQKLILDWKESQPYYHFNQSLLAISDFHQYIASYIKRIMIAGKSAGQSTYTLFHLLHFADRAHERKNFLLFFAIWNLLKNHKRVFQKEKDGKSKFSKLEKRAKKLKKASAYKKSGSLPYPFFASQFPFRKDEPPQIDAKLLSRFTEQTEEYARLNRPLLHERKKRSESIVSEIYGMHKEGQKNEIRKTHLYYAQQRISRKTMSLKHLGYDRMKISMPSSARQLADKQSSGLSTDSAEDNIADQNLGGKVDRGVPDSEVEKVLNVQDE